MGLGGTAIRLAALCLLLGLVACARPVPSDIAVRSEVCSLEPGGLITPSGTPVSLDGFASAARLADYVLIGEEHTNRCDHLAQAEIIRAMAREGLCPGVGLEMVSVDRQDALDRFNRGELKAADLEATLDWANTWGFPFALYAPIFRVAEEHGLPLIALNAPRDLVRKASREGLEALSPEERASLPERIIPASAEQRGVLEKMFEVHKSFIPADRPDPLGSFLRTQALWDTQMASRAVAFNDSTGRPVAVIAGGGHVEYGWGIRHRLDALDPGSRSIVVMPHRDLADADPDAADFYYYCPALRVSRLGFTLEMRRSGAAVVEVQPGSRADKAGFREGDLVVGVSGLPADSLWDLHRAAIEASREGRSLDLDIVRDGQRQALSIDVAGIPPKKMPE